MKKQWMLILLLAALAVCACAGGMAEGQVSPMDLVQLLAPTMAADGISSEGREPRAKSQAGESRRLFSRFG